MDRSLLNRPPQRGASVGKQSQVDAWVAPAVAVGKQSRAHEASARSQADALTQAEMAAAFHRELRAIEASAIPAYVAATRRDDLEPVAMQLELMKAAQRVQHMIGVVQGRMRQLVETAPHALTTIASMQCELDTVVARATELGVDRGAGEAQAVGADAAPFAATIQRKGDGTVAGDAVALAARGVQSATSALPHAKTIQRAFGRHDISTVRVQVGGVASQAMSALGAKAYTTGTLIAFGSEPDLHTAAHEAAHVVQQRSGLPMMQGVGRADDAFERHADRVADAVVAGQDAERVLDELGASTTAYAAGVIQRKDTPTAALTKLPANGKYEVAPGGMAASVVRAWLVEDPVAHYREVLGAMQAAGAVSWATADGLDRVAARTSRPSPEGSLLLPVRLDAAAIAMIGLPPASSAMVQRTGDGLAIAIRVDGVGDAQVNTRIDLSARDLAAVQTAVEQFTGLHPVAGLAITSIGASEGTVYVRVTNSALAKAFGARAWTAWTKERGHASADAAAASSGPVSVAHELTPDEHARVSRFFEQVAVDGKTPATPMDRTMLALIDEVESQPFVAPAIIAELRKAGRDGRPLTLLSLRDALERARFEVDRARFGLGERPPTATELMGGSAPKVKDAVAHVDVAARIVQRGLVLA